MEKAFLDSIYEIIDRENVKLDEPMKNHTTFRIGGNAEVFAQVATSEIADLIKLCKVNNVPYVILGNGSNVLVGDKGVKGVVISVGNRMSSIEVENDEVFAEAGALLSQVANMAATESLTGMEFAAGIPGSIGGAVLMNAGAYGGEIKDILVSVKLLTEDGEIVERLAKDLDLSYRHSAIMSEGGVVLSARLKLKKGDEVEIRKTMTELKEKRVEKQPLNYPSAGSTFKRPEGYFAAKLIDDCGLRGYRVGGAQVSEKHCGFVVNVGNATASDVLNVMKDVNDKVKSAVNVELEPEVRMIGEFE